MDKFERHKRVLKRELNQLKSQLGDFSNKSSLNLEQISKLESILCDFKPKLDDYRTVVADLLEEQITVENYETIENELMNEIKVFSETYFACDAKVRSQKQKLTNEQSRNALVSDPAKPQNGSNSSILPKLQKITIPDFDGDILSFRNFRALFENLVHFNAELSNVQKLYYLKTSLVGTAKEILRDFPLEENAYVEAWNYLINRYDNKRMVIRLLFRKFMSLDQIKNASQIRSLLDEVDIILRGLKANGLEIGETFSQFVCFFVSSRLDNKTCADWENSLDSSTEFPAYKQIETFLKNRIFVVEERKPTKNDKPGPSRVDKQSLTVTKPNATPKIKCVVCNESHFLNQCKIFLSKSLFDRFQTVRENKLCIKCFSPFHLATDCKRFNCKTCDGPHHILLHRDRNIISSSKTEPPKPTNEGGEKSEPGNKVSLATVNSDNRKQVYLSTAVVFAKTESNPVPIRILIDSGSEATLITHSCVRKLGLQKSLLKNPTRLHGIMPSATILKYEAALTIISRMNNFKISVNAEIVPNLPYSVPSLPFKEISSQINVQKLAECDLLKYSNIDMIIGAEYAEFICENNRFFIDGLVLRQTKFGYVLSGALNDQKNSLKTCLFTQVSEIDIDKQLKRFWEIEDLPTQPGSNEHDEIEKHFMNTYSRDENGKFIVRLPVKSSIGILNGSFEKARNILFRAQKRNNETQSEYEKFMNEYLSLGHMRKLTDDEIQVENCYYIPHHMVKKLSSTTTKYRVVFNASSKDASGTSLNDHLYVGPTLQPELIDTILRFRQHKIGFCADIEKMYRQIWVHPDDRKHQRIVWWDENHKLSHHELNTITYGTGPASFQATKCLQILGNELQESSENAATFQLKNLLKIAAKSIQNDFYIDDWMSGSNSIEEALQLQQTVHNQLSTGGMPLRKYQSNSSEFLQKIDSSLVQGMEDRILGAESFVTVLGLIWRPKSDVFSVALYDHSIREKITKRVILSEISKVFDVLGMLTPVTIRSKIILQNLWRENVNWDDEISDELKVEFVEYLNDLILLKTYSIPRWYTKFDNVKMRQLVGFCDASVKAYCAIIYVRTVDFSNNVTSVFLCSKSRVAPLKALTIPRLELQGALLLAQLLKRMSCNLGIDTCYAFCDSTIVLSWLNNGSLNLKTFVANRVEKIHNLFPNSIWNFVSTDDNPADLGTRGINVRTFLDNEFWKVGPKWLIDDFESHINVMFEKPEILPDTSKTKQIFVATIEINFDETLIQRFSNLNTLINVTCYILRFYNLASKKACNFETKTLSVDERNSAFSILIKLAQLENFGSEILRLQNNKPVSKNSSLRALDPFIDEYGILRVGGRLRNSTLPYDKKHPVILNSKNRLVYLLVGYLHEKYFHCNKSIIVTYMQAKFWIVNGLTNVVKKVICECLFCKRLRAVSGNQLMGQLPAPRVGMNRPFSFVGIDFTGHINVKCLNHRSVKINKSYIAFFVCFSTRAVHLEVVSDLTTERFLDALRRFVSRRGKPIKVFSDNGRNFLGASKHLEHDSKCIRTWTNNENIAWQFIAPRSPHQGGLWESAVKSGKNLLLKAIGTQTLTIEELQTVTCEIEAILNSRPISRMMDNSNEIIIPGHFLIGDHLLITPINMEVADMKLSKRFFLTRSIVDSFWRTWYKTYLNDVQKRNKWSEKEINFKVDDIVLMKDENVSVLDWPMGRVVQVFPGPDDVVRNVEVTTKNGNFVRSIQKLIPLILD